MALNIQKSLAWAALVIGLGAANVTGINAQTISVQPKQKHGISSLFKNVNKKKNSDSPSLGNEPSKQKASIASEPLSIEELAKANSIPTKPLANGMVLLDVKTETLTLPTTVHYSEDKEVIYFWIKIANLSETQIEDKNRLLELVNNNYYNSSIGFIYLANTRNVMLYATIPQATVNKQRFAKQISKITDVLKQTRPNWDTDFWTTPRHVGTWSSSQTSATLALTNDGHFNWIQESSDTSVNAKGTFKITSDKLTLIDSSGHVVESKIYFINGNQLEVEINGQTVVFERA